MPDELTTLTFFFSFLSSFRPLLLLSNQMVGTGLLLSRCLKNKLICGVALGIKVSPGGGGKIRCVPSVPATHRGSCSIL